MIIRNPSFLLSSVKLRADRPCRVRGGGKHRGIGWCKRVRRPRSTTPRSVRPRVRRRRFFEYRAGGMACRLLFFGSFKCIRLPPEKQPRKPEEPRRSQSQQKVESVANATYEKGIS